MTNEEINAVREVIAKRGECDGPLTTFDRENNTSTVGIICRDNWSDVIRWLAACVKYMPAALDEIERLKQEDREAISARNTLGAALMVADNEHSSSLVDCAQRAADLVMECVRLRAEVAAMQPVLDAAVGYCMSPSGCHRSEARLVEAAGLYHANRRMLENASVLEANVVRTSRFTMGAECSACGHRHAGPDVGHICIGCPCEERPVDTAERK